MLSLRGEQIRSRDQLVFGTVTPGNEGGVVCFYLFSIVMYSLTCWWYKLVNVQMCASIHRPGNLARWLNRLCHVTWRTTAKASEKTVKSNGGHIQLFSGCVCGGGLSVFWYYVLHCEAKLGVSVHVPVLGVDYMWGRSHTVQRTTQPGNSTARVSHSKVIGKLLFHHI